MLSAIVDIIEFNILVQQQLQRLCLTSEESQLRAEFQLQGQTVWVEYYLQKGL